MPAPCCPLDAAFADLPAGPLLLGFSGGLDSRVLLHALAARAGDRLQAIHVHHGLHPQADAWAAHCATQAAMEGVPLRVVRVAVDRDSGLGLEGAARLARYAAFRSHAEASTTLVLAHQRDDQAETLLLRLLRRSGLHGAAAMRRWSRRRDGLVLWRPLLDLPRQALADYARQHRLACLDDPLNADPELDRGFLRQRLLPLLRQRWPAADAALAGSAALLGGQASALAVHRRRQLAGCRGLDPHTLSVTALLAVAPSERVPLLADWLNGLGLALPPAAVLSRLGAGLLGHTDDRGYPAMSWGDCHFERYRDLLHVGPAGAAWQGPDVDWDGRTAIDLGAAGWLALQPAAAQPQAWRISPRRGGEHVVLPGKRSPTPLKNALQALGLPPWERRRLPLLCGTDGTLLAAGDLLYGADFSRWLDEQGARLRWTPPPWPTPEGHTSR